MNEKKEKRSVVPWFCMAEWEQTYNDLYSDDNKSQTRGYERLLVWKARVPVLPSSIECTLELIQVCLRDREVAPNIHSGKLPAYVEHDLRLMYSTSVMRFLNNLSSYAQNADETLFSMAKKLFIPEWLVSLRHDTAHGFNLPSLDVLRTAAHVALDWLREHYWKCEAETTSDWVLKEDSSHSDVVEDTTDLAELMDSWQALKLHLLGGYTRVVDLPDSQLRKYIQDTAAPLFKETAWLQYVINLLFMKLLKAIAELYKKKGPKLNDLIELIVTRESFIPSASCMKLLGDCIKVRCEGDRVPLWLLNLWKDLLSSLQKSHSILPILACRLLSMTNSESSSLHQRHIAALWVKELCRGLEKGQKVLKKVNQFERRKRHAVQDKCYRKQFMRMVSSKMKGRKAIRYKLSRKVVWEMMKNKLEDDDPGWKTVLCLELKEPLGSICSNTVLRETLIKANFFTQLFLPSLLELIVPPIPQRAKENLLSLVRIYTDAPKVDILEEEVVDTPIHTVQELMGLGEPKSMDVIEESQVPPADRTTQSYGEAFQSTVPSNWIRCKDDGQWSGCPLGILPWQRDKVPTFDMPSEILWQPQEPTRILAQVEKNLPGLFHQTIDWGESIKRRPRRSKSEKCRKLGAKYVQKAFTFVSGRKLQSTSSE